MAAKVVANKSSSAQIDKFNEMWNKLDNTVSLEHPFNYVAAAAVAFMACDCLVAKDANVKLNANCFIYRLIKIYFRVQIMSRLMNY